jgi:hypothetical protein
MQKIFVLVAIAIIALLAFKSTNQFIVTGKITDDAGHPIAGASVKLDGTNAAVQSDLQGNYSIHVPDEKAILQFSAVGYETKKLKSLQTKSSMLH